MVGETRFTFVMFRGFSASQLFNKQRRYCQISHKNACEMKNNQILMMKIKFFDINDGNKNSSNICSSPCQKLSII
jgi:hypothetical protein